MTTAGLNFSWGPPDPKVLGFSNCGLAVTYYLSYMVDYTYPYESGGALLRDGLSSYLRNRTLEDPPLHELAQWYEKERFVDKYGHSQSTVGANLQDWIEKSCQKELCPQLGWQGNSDVAGRGMVVTYVVQAVLVAIYLPILLSIRFNKIPERIDSLPALGRFVQAVQHSTETFLNVSFIFCISMLLAGIVACAQMFSNHSTISSPTMFSLMACYSTIPAVLLQTAASRMLRRRNGRRLIWFFISVLVVALTPLVSLVIITDPNDKRPEPGAALTNLKREQLNQAYWEQLCAYNGKFGFYWSLLTPVMMSCCILALVYISRFVFLAIRKPKETRSKHWNCWRIFWWIGMVLNFITMWFILIWFIYFRAQMELLGGDSNKEMEWSFGQILALATWIPVILELGYIWWQTPAEALSGRLMDPFQVVDASKPPELDELVRGDSF